MHTKHIPKVAQQVIQQYIQLKLGNKKVRCPYYINLKRSKDLRAMVGKGTPEEIEMESHIWAKLKGINFSKMTDDEIRDFLMDRGIGIDCSGFILHVLNTWYKDKTGASLWRQLTIPNKTFLARVAYILKPVEKLGAEIITNDENSLPIEINDVKPGDVIRTKWKKQNSHHILLITTVEYDEHHNTKLIEYTHSSPQYGKQSGVKIGQIKITDPNLPLKDQQWLEVDENGVNHVYEGFLIHNNDNGLRRIKAMENIL